MSASARYMHSPCNNTAAAMLCHCVAWSGYAIFVYIGCRVIAFFQEGTSSVISSDKMDEIVSSCYTVFVTALHAECAYADASYDTLLADDTALKYPLLSFVLQCLP